ILPKGYPHPISFEWAPPFRFIRIQQRLDGQEKFSLDDFKSMQQDNTTLPGGKILARLIRGLKFTDPAIQTLAESFAAWDGNLSRSSQPGAIYGVWMDELQNAVFRPHVPAKLLRAVSARFGIYVMVLALLNPTVEWFGDDPTAARDRLLHDTFVAA